MLKIQAQRSLSLLPSRIISPFFQNQIPSIRTLFAQFSHTPWLCRNPNEGYPESARKLLVVQPRLLPKSLLHAKLNEAVNLANSLEERRDGYFATDLSGKQLPLHVVVQNPLASSKKGLADTYFGPGTVKNVECHIHAVESQRGELDAVFVNATLSAIQQRNLERDWGKPVLDRVGLIIEIFHAHANTKEAKLQAELAALTYKKSRLVRVRGKDGRYLFGGDAEVVSARGRGSGGCGFISGAGETELELQRRRISERRKQVLAEIADVRRTRAVQRSARRKQGASDSLGLATVAVVGYTNAGKSTLVNALSDSDLYCDDRLFATVDPQIRGVRLPSGRKILLSDTVGFISDLPVQLVEAFHATLEEVVEADLLVHVLDSSAPNLDEQWKAVLDVLRQIGVSEEKIEGMIEVWNKIDLQGDTEGENLDDNYDDNLDEEGGENGVELELQNVVENQQNDYSDGQLEPGSDQESNAEQVYASTEWTGSGDLNTISNEGKCADNDPQREHVPHVKTSALTRVGLRELLELIDEKLNKIEEERKQSQRVVERSIFYQKWRPPQSEDTGIAVER